VGETRVDLQHLLEDIRDAYPGALEETILTEIVANSLDSGATLLRVEADSSQATLTVIDDGSGMARRELKRYHDIAASTKTRGEGIGFAGVGIKLGLLACKEVVTESRRGSSHVATTWRLVSKHRAPWKRVTPPGLVGEHGTAVRLTLHNPLSPLLEAGYIEASLVRHFQPLFDTAFDEILAGHYSDGVRFVVNGREMPRATGPERAALAVRIGRRQKPSATGFLVREDAPLPEDQQGLGISTLGKVIKRGWDWLGFSPAEPDLISGLIEVPALAGCLTLNKADFIRVGPRGALYLTHRKAIQEAVSAQLAAWGEERGALEEDARRRKTRPVERDLAGVLLEMAEDFPLIASLVERRAGGQKRLAMGRAPEGPQPVGLASQPDAAAAPSEATQPSAGEAPGPASEAPSPPLSEPPVEDVKTGPGSSDLNWPTPRGKRRPARLGLSIDYESRPDDPGLSRLLESTVWVNDSHPAYRRAAASRAEGYHLALSVAMALAPLAVEATQAHAFVSAFLGHWGEAVERPGPKRRPGPRPRSRKASSA
jgi:hypothetical protein